MKKGTLFLIWIGVTALVLLGCGILTDSVSQETVRGSGTTTTEERAIRGVRQVEMASIGNLSIEIGSEERLMIEAEKNLLPYIESNVSGGRLTLETRRGINISPTEPIRYSLTVTRLEAITISGLGNVEAPRLTAGDFRVRIPGSGDVTIAGLTADKLDVGINGSGDVRIESGQVDDLEVDIYGSGNYNSRDMESARADVSISGAGTVTLWVRESMRVRISGAGNVRYLGDPPDVEQSISGAGSVIRIDD